MPALSSGVIGGLIATALVGLVARTGGTLPMFLLRAGTFIGFVGMSAFFFYIYFFVGSARPDAPTPMRYMLGLAVSFLAAGAYCGYSLIRHRND